MPPKMKFTKDEVRTAALNLARQNGLSAVTARDLGTALGSSSHPVFSVFKNMEDVRQETVRAARELYNGYIAKALYQ